MVAGNRYAVDPSSSLTEVVNPVNPLTSCFAYTHHTTLKVKLSLTRRHEYKKKERILFFSKSLK